MRRTLRCVPDVVWHALSALLPPTPAPEHPLGCHRPRVPDKTIFECLWHRFQTGCSYEDAARPGCSATTLRRRRNEWVEAGVFEHLFAEAVQAVDRLGLLDLTHVLVDGSSQKAPCGGGTGPNPTDRGKQGWKWSIATDRNGLPVAAVSGPGNRHDSKLLAPTLDVLVITGLVGDVGCVHLDRGYDTPAVHELLTELGVESEVRRIRRQRGRGTRREPIMERLGVRWPVERTNSWLANRGQLRRATDRSPEVRQAWLLLGCVVVLVQALVRRRERGW